MRRGFASTWPSGSAQAVAPSQEAPSRAGAPSSQPGQRRRQAFPPFQAVQALADNLVFLQARNRIYTEVPPCPDKIEVTRDLTERKIIYIRETEDMSTFPESRV